MKIVVKSRVEAPDFDNAAGWVAISITNPGDHPIIFNGKNILAVLRLQFDDVERVQQRYVAFSMAQAAQVWDFVQTHRDVDTLLVHCTMGLCRSPAIAAAVDKVLGGDDNHWFVTKKPNRRVHLCMLKEAHARGLI